MYIHTHTSYHQIWRCLHDIWIYLNPYISIHINPITHYMFVYVNRSYFNCNEKDRCKCKVVKRTQRCSNDEDSVVFTYFGRHNHPAWLLQGIIQSLRNVDIIHRKWSTFRNPNISLRGFFITSKLSYHIPKPCERSTRWCYW